jgi:hypothetical protein
MSDEKTPTTPASDRAREAWESVPGDSEAAVDYPPKTDGVVTNIINSALPDYYELAVEINVRTPDGTVITHSEAVECKDEGDYSFDEAITMLDASYRVMADRLGR